MFQRLANRTTHADTLFQAGSAEGAEALFKAAEKMQQEFQPEFPILYSLAGFYFCDLVLARGNPPEAQRRAAQTLVWAKEHDLQLLTIALDHLTLGRAALEMASAESDSDFAEAERELTDAVEGLRKSGHQDDLPRGLLARAVLFRVQGNFAQSRRDLDEAYEIATLGEMRLHECDVHIECSRMLLATIEAEESLKAESISPVSPFALFDAATDPLAAARGHREKAAEMVKNMGYHRRDPELLLTDAHLMIHEGKLDPARGKLTEAKATIDEMGLHIHDRVARDLEALLEKSR